MSETKTPASKLQIISALPPKEPSAHLTHVAGANRTYLIPITPLEDHYTHGDSRLMSYVGSNEGDYVMKADPSFSLSREVK